MRVLNDPSEGSSYLKSDAVVLNNPKLLEEFVVEIQDRSEIPEVRELFPEAVIAESIGFDVKKKHKQYDFYSKKLNQAFSVVEMGLSEVDKPIEFKIRG